VDLTWADNSTNETGSEVWRSTANGAFARVAVLAADAISYADKNLLTGTSYTYEVRATNAGGASAYSNQATGVPTNVAPAAPTNLAATVASSTQVNLTWSDNSNNETAFSVWHSTDGGLNWTRIAVLIPNSTSYSDTGLSPNTSYTYRVRATNNVGASAWSNQVTVTTPP
jgi:fibronectin type 3 domain-containing protein